LRYEFVKGGYVKLRYTYFDRYYSDFNPNDLTESSGTAGKDSWEFRDTVY